MQAHEVYGMAENAMDNLRQPGGRLSAEAVAIEHRLIVQAGEQGVSVTIQKNTTNGYQDEDNLWARYRELTNLGFAVATVADEKWSPEGHRIEETLLYRVTAAGLAALEQIDS